MPKQIRGDGVARVCDCGMFVRPAAQCPSGRCLTEGRRALGVLASVGRRTLEEPVDSLRDRGLGVDNGCRWVSGEHNDDHDALPKEELP